MINVWWLLIICPICALLGWIGHALVFINFLNEIQIKKEIEKNNKKL